MNFLVIGLGIQGNKRLKTLNKYFYKTVDPFNKKANFKTITEAISASKINFDSAIICTPDNTKYQLILECLKFNMNILVEKPLFFLNQKKFKKIETIANRKKLLIYTAYNHRFEKFIIKSKEIIKSNILGKLYFCNLFYGNGTAKLVKKSEWKDSKNGVIFDLGSHLLDLIDYFFNIKPKKINKKISFSFENNAPDYAFLNYNYKEMNINLEMTYCMWENSFKFELIGEKGSLQMYNFCKWGRSELIIQKRIFPAGKPIKRKFITVEKDKTWNVELKYFINQIKQKKLTNLSKDYWIYNQLKKINHEKK